MPPKRRRRFQGLYYHSSPPKVMPMNGQTANQNGRKRRDTDDFSVKLSTIRIWMHEKEIGKLTRILWAGQGHRLCQQASNNGRVKRFLAAVPHVMNAIKDLHQAVIDNNLETLQMKLEPPVPPALVTSRDANALNVIHKAAGLGHAKILEYLVSIWPEGAHETDITGKTPLHWAASAKNNMRCYTLLTQAGCNEEAQDYKMKTPSYYRHKPHEIERAFLVFVPEAPRVPPDSTTDWEALSDDNESNGGGDSKKLDIKIPPAPLNELNGDGAETTSEPDTNDGTSANGEEDSSKTEAEPITEPTPAVEGDGDDPLNNNENGIEKGNEKGNENGAENITRTLSADEAPAVEEDEVKADADPEPEPDPGPEPQEEGEENGTHSNDEKQETEANVEQENETTGAELQNGEVEQNDQEENETEKTEAPTKLEENENAHESSENENVETASNNGKEAPAGDDEEDDDEDVVAPSQGGQQASLELEPGVQQELQQMEQPYEQDGTDSPTSSLAIEGFVQGASDDYTVQSQTAAYEVDEDTRIQQIIASGDLEQLAQIVLNGDGGRLLGLQTKEPEVQAFLNNVPSYMEKIRRVHDAAREGGLSALQQALDRRKFAIAKDDISPNGSTPLHVAVLFGHSDIVRYLASRFPETMDATDNDGRTPIHYAATIKDNGHFYNVLMQLGANTKVVDKLGHTPEFYLDVEKSKEILTYTELLNIYGAEELENQLLSDQGQTEHTDFQSNPIFKTEQGKYLAESLADPLIKALTEIANKRPKDPVAYLAGYLQKFMQERKPHLGTFVHAASGKNSSMVANSGSLPANASHTANIDAIEVDEQSMAEEDAAAAQQLEDRDEHGQSLLHFACARSHRRGALYTLIEESNIDLTYRDELYRTARDVALQANQPNNAAEIDRFLLAQAVVGDVKPFEHLALQGYDHVLDIQDDNGKSIVDVAVERGNEELAEYFRNLRSMEESREELHQMIRDVNMERIQELTGASNSNWLIKTKNYYGRTALHIAVLKESEEIVEHLIKLCPDALKVTDNLERTVLHYAMGTNALESVSRILIQNGAKRTAKDLKGRQPSYYFMNKADILRLQEEEEETR